MEARIGKYELQSELGRGGFGRVYRAYDPAVGRPVAIKVLASEDDPELLARFRAEAGTTGKLQHKNIVTVFDCGEQDGAPYIVMELLEGENLQTILQAKRSLGLLEKMRILCQVAEGLYYAHQSGVIHRDVKPANIMLLPSGIVKIMDFGIARLVSMGSSRRTRSGDLIGTTSYMSPEQFRGGDADIQTDIFAYGVIFYELLSGVHPFQATDVSAVIYRIMSVEPPLLSEVLQDCPQALESLVHRALAKDRERRYSSLDDVLIDAEPIILDLRRDQAIRLMSEVKALIDQGDFDSANVKLKQALELDPSNRDARRVRETLQEERRRRILEENIQSLEREASVKQGKRQFADAVQTLEAALRLKPGDARLQSLVSEMRAKLLANREAGRLLAEAKMAAQNEQLQEARSLALRALDADPDHPECPPLIQHLEDEIERLENAKRLRAGIEESERLLSEGEYEQAIVTLQALEEVHPGSLQVSELQTRVRTRQMEDYRRKRLARLETELAKARQLQSDGEYAGALDVLDSLLADFPGVSAIENLRSSVKEELSADERAVGFVNLLDEARALVWSRQLGEAISLLQEGLKAFPSDAGLERLLEAAKALDLDLSRQRDLAEIRDTARSLRKENRVDEALELLKNGIRIHGNDTILSDMCRVLVLELEDRRASERLQRYRATATNLLSSGSIAEALAVLREARTHYPTEPSLELLLATAEEHYTKQSEDEIVVSVLRSSSNREKADDLAGALEEISKGLRRLPSSKDLLLAVTSLRSKMHSAERERRIQRLATEIRAAMDSGDWTQAVASVTAAQREFPDQILFDELAVEVQRRQRTAEVEKAVAGVRESLKQGNLEWAAITLAQLEPAYGSDDIWKAEKRNLERRHAYLDNLRRAEELRKNGNYQEAGKLLQVLVQEDPNNEQAARLWKFVSSELGMLHPQEVLRQKQQEADQLVAAGDLAGAALVLTKLAEQFPEEPQVAEALAKVRAQMTPSTNSGGEPGKVKRRVRFAEALAALKTPVRTCSGCHVVLPERARFCDNCGKPVG